MKKKSIGATDAGLALDAAELILRLYELRREPVMRQARSYVGGPFMPQSVDDLVNLASAGDQNTGFILQVYGYWDMVSAFVIHGALNEPLVYDTCQEMYFQYAKIQPYLADFRERMNLPEFLRSIEAVVEGSTQGLRRLASMRQNISAISEMRNRNGSAPKDQ